MIARSRHSDTPLLVKAGRAPEAIAFPTKLPDLIDAIRQLRAAESIVNKRAFDIVLATALLPFAVVIIALVAPIVWWESRANPLFVQTRVGRHRRPFAIVKLRTMRPDTLNLASHEVEPARITRSGRWLRRLKFDELPQLINVIRGDMSLVGPRPCLPTQTELIEARGERGVFNLRPGITGPSQIAGIDMSTPKRLAECDSAYLGPWSLARDMRLIVATAIGHGRGDAARVSR